MVVNKALTLYLGAPAEVQRPVYVSQNDTGWAFVCTVYNGTQVWTIPSGTTATINGSKPDGTAFSYVCTISGNQVTAPCEEQMTVIPGDVACEIKFTQGGRVIATANFRLIVEESPTGEYVPSETELGALDDALDEVQTIAAQVRAAYGAPRTAATAADMTDTNLIYVYTGTTSGTMVNGHWYYYNGTAWTDGGVYNSTAFETDPTLTISGAAADAKATGDAIAEVKDDIASLNLYTNYAFTVANSRVTESGRVVAGSNGDYRTDYIACVEGQTAQCHARSFIYQGASASCLIAFFDASKTYLSGIIKIDNETKNTVGTVRAVAPENTAYVIFSTHGLEDAFYGRLYYDTKAAIDDINVSIERHSANVSVCPQMRNGAVSNPGNASAIAMVNVAPIKNAKSVRVFANVEKDPGDYFDFRFTTYSAYGDTTANSLSSRIRIDRIVVGDAFDSAVFAFKDGEIGFAVQILRFTEGAERVPLRVESVPEYPLNFVYVYPTPEDSPASANYVLDSALMKRPVSLSLLGVLEYVQSFLKYGDYYYSTDGSNIAKQDASFALVNNVALSVGHGNAFQLGHGNLAYISGWNDNKIYVVNLDTLTLDSTITLPTTGYTTAVVNDLIGYAYIFQRDTYPTTEERYNFIVYDYVNQTIISTKQTSIKMAAMQACDFYNDRIIVLHGGGTSAMPNGYHVFDCNGNVLADYVINGFSTQEPEGVCIDRDTRDLLISYYGKSVYKVTG